MQSDLSFEILARPRLNASHVSNYSGWIKFPASTTNFPCRGQFNSISQSDGRMIGSLAPFAPSYGHFWPQVGHYTSSVGASVDVNYVGHWPNYSADSHSHITAQRKYPERLDRRCAKAIF